MNYDLSGEPVWVTKETFNTNKEYFAGREDAIAEELLTALEDVDGRPLDGPGEFKNFEKLVHAMSYRISATVNDPLYLEEVLRRGEGEYIIVFHVRGHGVQAPDQHRVEQVLIHLKYHPDKGIIQAIESNVESSLKKHEWLLMPADFEFHFMPSQSQDEIINTLSTIMKFF